MTLYLSFPVAMQSWNFFVLVYIELQLLFRRSLAALYIIQIQPLLIDIWVIAIHLLLYKYHNNFTSHDTVSLFVIIFIFKFLFMLKKNDTV